MTARLVEMEKAELHVHLEGSIRPATLQEIAPEFTMREIEERYRFHDFPGFLVSYKWVTSLLNGPAPYSLATRRLIEELAVQNVRYAEINLSVGVILRRNHDAAAIFDAVNSAAKKGPVKVRWVFDAVRQFGPAEAMRVVELAAERTSDGVVAFGMGGDESQYNSEEFASVFAFARRRGLCITPHAGETTNAESVWGALRLGANRIGHGIRAVEDPALLRHLRDHDIPLEICITSNVATGSVPSLAAHPLRAIFDAGVPVVLNTDDPAMFGTTLNREYELAATRFGFSEAELEHIVKNGFRYAFSASDTS